MTSQLIVQVIMLRQDRFREQKYRMFTVYCTIWAKIFDQLLGPLIPMYARVNKVTRCGTTSFLLGAAFAVTQHSYIFLDISEKCGILQLMKVFYFFSVTDSNGRIAFVHPAYDLKEGHYLLHFYTGSYFSSLGMETFYPYIEVSIDKRLPKQWRIVVQIDRENAYKDRASDHLGRGWGWVEHRRLLSL